MQGVKLKKYCTAWLLFFLTCTTLLSQSWNSTKYNSVTTKNFRDNSLFKETINFSGIDYPRLHAAIFFVTNEARVKNGLPELKYHRLLEESATAHSKRMVRMGFFNHFDPYNDLLKTPSDRLRFAGIKNAYAAENIATPFAIQYMEGFTIYPLDDKNNFFSYSPGGKAIPNHTYLSLAEYVVDLWMKSEGHRANILNPNAKQLGCGIYFYRERNNIPKFMATQNFQLYEEIVEEDK